MGRELKLQMDARGCTSLIFIVTMSLLISSGILIVMSVILSPSALLFPSLHTKRSIPQSDEPRDEPGRNSNKKLPLTPLSEELLSTAPKDVRNVAASTEWQRWAIERLWEERRLMAYTPIVKFEHIPGVLIIFKNESAAHSENLKHRFAWALFFWAVMEGHVRNGTTIYEASSGNTAFSEVYMARLLQNPFVSVVPDSTEPAKVHHIEQAGARIVKVPLGEIQSAAREMAANDENHGFFMNQFGNADSAEEYHQSQHDCATMLLKGRGKKCAGEERQESSNIFYELFVQMGDSAPSHFVHSAATGGTLSSVGRFVKKYDLGTEIVLADPEFSLYYDYVVGGKFDGRRYPLQLSPNDTAILHAKWVAPGVAGTGFGPLWGLPIRGRTSSLVPSVVDRVIKVPDLASVAAMQVLAERFGISGGPSTGLNFIAALEVAVKEKAKSRDVRINNGTAVDPVMIATLICDKGRNYAPTYYNRTWLAEHFMPHGGLLVLDCWRHSIAGVLDEAAAGKFPYSSVLEKGGNECRPNLRSHD